MTTDRETLMTDWLDARAGRLGLDISRLAPASSDASFRRYFRLPCASTATPSDTLIVMDAPPGLEDAGLFVRVQKIFAETGVHVPKIIDLDLEVGFLLLEDLGQTPYLSVLNEQTAPALYNDAFDALVRFQCGTQHQRLPLYSADLLQREMALFREWYCDKHLGLSLTSDEHTMLDRTFALLAANNTAQPQVYVHRDYHSRNLMSLDDRNPGIIDFQDAVTGPISYDLVSLLRDAYISWDEEQQIDWVVRYWEKARRARLPVPMDIADFYRDVEWMGLQRHLKVLGIFARLWHRDGKGGYLNDLPRVLGYARRCAARYGGLGGLARLLDRCEV